MINMKNNINMEKKHKTLNTLTLQLYNIPNMMIYVK